MIVRTDAVVLRALDFGETSRIVTLLTQTHGVVGAIARGARRPTSRFGSTLQPMACVQAVLYHRPGRGLQTLKETAHALRFPHLDGRDLERVTLGLRAVEAARLALDEGDTHPMAFRLLVEALAAIDAGEGVLANAVPWFQLRLAALLGVAPDVQRDDLLALGDEGGALLMDSGAVVPAGARALDGPDGGPILGGVRASRGALRAFGTLARTPLETALRLRLTPDERRETDTLVDAYVRTHLGSGFPERVRAVTSQMAAGLDAPADPRSGGA